MGFLGEPIHVKGYIALKAIFGVEENARLIKVRYLVIDESSSYNMIIGRHSSNQLRTAPSTSYLCMKHPLMDGIVSIIQGAKSFLENAM